MSELITLFFGNATVAQIAFNFIMINVGIAFSVVYHVSKGIKQDELSPDNFDFKYFIKKNYIRVAGVGLTMFITWVYMEEMVQGTATVIPDFMARLTPLVMGILNDRIYIWITNFTKTKE